MRPGRYWIFLRPYRMTWTVTLQGRPWPSSSLLINTYTRKSVP
jgi:hypothetical protein